MTAGASSRAALAGLSVDHAAVLVIDLQERLCAAMPADVVARVVRNTEVVLEAARRFRLPVVVSEQYPKGLGPTVAALQPSLERLEPTQLSRVEKLEFSALACDAFAPIWSRLAGAADADAAGSRRHGGISQWIIVGMETHVCVLQTVRDLCRRGASVHVICDAVASRTKANFRVGLAQMAAMSSERVVMSSMEAAVFDLLQRAQGDDFKALSKMLR
jgi:nicotinamidase-related amidase